MNAGGDVGLKKTAAVAFRSFVRLNCSLILAPKFVKIVDTVETAYKIAICPRGNLPYMRIYLITN